MSTIVDPRKASPELLTQPAELISQHISTVPEGTSEYYLIDDIQESESAWIFFAYKENAEREQYVIKLLRPCTDKRYHLELLLRRQRCQLEALTCNTKFSPDVYIGLAGAYRLQVEQKRLVLSQPTYDPSKLDSNTEYALVMRRLPSKSRLDSLLEHEDKDMLHQHLHHLVMRIVEIHKASPSLSPEKSREWGSFIRVKKKLKHNLSLADPIFRNSQDTTQTDEWRERFLSLKNNLRRVFEHYRYTKYFDHRVSQGYIKHCHGDLKGPNIWIEQRGAGEQHTIAILDAIDFNLMYSNIDTLSDFATLVIDIQTRLHDKEFALSITQEMIEKYLEVTGQHKDTAARAVLTYYLLEKAYVGAAISIVHDGLPELGTHFLQAAEVRWYNFSMKQQPATPNKNLQEPRIPAALIL